MPLSQSLIYLAVATSLGLLNAFFVFAEFAIVKVRTTRIRELAQGGGNARLAYDILQKMDVYLSACQVGVTLASLAIGWLAEPALAALIGRLFGLTGWAQSALSDGLAFGLALLMITSVHVVAGELAPKMIA